MLGILAAIVCWSLAMAVHQDHEIAAYCLLLSAAIFALKSLFGDD